MSTTHESDRRSALALVEEATHLLRRTPVMAWELYYLGGAPFVAYLFFFWSDMSRSASAPHRLLESSLILALLYWIMKVGQALFCDYLMRQVKGQSALEPLKLRGWLRLVSSQAWIHATMPWVLPLSSIAMIPFGWVYAFYHNFTAMSVEHFRRGGNTRSLISLSITQSNYGIAQNHLLLLILFVLGLLVYLNLMVTFVMVTQLSKSFTGVENSFTMHPMLYLSSTLQALLIGVSYLVINPFVKALYVLRCFYGAARKNGADLEVRLRKLAKVALVTFCLLAGLGFANVVVAQDANVLAQTSVDTGNPENVVALDRSIRDVLQSSEFQWRMPRDMSAEPADTSWLGSLIRNMAASIEEAFDSFGKVLGNIRDWLFGGKDADMTEKSGEQNTTWLALLPKLLILLLVVIVLLLAWLVYRSWKLARKTVIVEAPAAVPEINLESENVVASQLPENEWLRLAQEKMESGELRLALRALFLATLAHLGEKRLLKITRSKSNGDYVRELGWRARGREDLSDGFSQQVRTFDSVWYGWHEVSADLMTQFQQQHERITHHAS